MENEEMVVKCEIELDRIFFPKGKTTVPSGEYAIFSAIITKSIENCGNLHGRIKLKGNVSELNYCESYNVTCRLADQNAKYGDTYEILFMNRIVDLKDEIKQRNFLMSILNENTVQRLFEMYGDKVIELLDNKDIDSLSKVKGVGVKSAMKLIEKYESCKDYGEVYAELGHLGLSKTLIKRLVDYYKSPDTLIDVIKTNPYVLVEVDSIGFKKADEIAAKCGITGNNPNRVKGCIIYILTTNGASGRSYLHYAELLQNINSYIGYVDEDVINQVAQNLIEEKLVHVSQDGQFIGLSKFHDLEKNIAIELKRLLTADSRVNIDEVEESIKRTEEEQGFEFTEEQRDAVRLFAQNNIIAMTGGAGCVDCDTEFFTGTGWKRIADYQEGDKVLQYNENGTAELVYPMDYIKQPSEYLWHFETKYGINQCLSDNHTVVYETSKKNLYKKTFKEVRESHERTSKGFSGKFYTTFKYSGKGINLTDDEIKLMCAVICDGYFPKDRVNNKCYINLKKQRKKDELEKLLKQIKIEYTINKGDEGYSKYYFEAPLKIKEFTSDWYNCTSEQLNIITDNILKWDGSTYGGRMSFSTCNKNTADFIQFAFSSQNMRCKLNTYDRVGEIRKSQDGKEYIRKSIEYTLTISNKTKPTIGGFHKDDPNKTKIEKYKTKDGYEYCFTVPSHMLVLRRGGCIFITGNCGKSTTARGMYNLTRYNYHSEGTCLAGKAALVLQESTGMQSSTIHRLLKYQNGKFLYNKDCKMDLDVLFIDESSMVNGELMLSILQSLPDGSKIVFIGDVQQLTPIGSCQVFYDLLNSSLVPKALLTKPHRQALKSGIITTSLSVINQEQIFDSSFEGFQTRGELNDMDLLIYKDKTGKVDEVVNIYMKYLKEADDIMDVEIVTPMKLRGDLSVYNLNTLIQSKINPINPKRKHIVNSLDKDHTYTIQVGDKVMNTTNKYDVPLANETTIDEFGFEHVKKTDVFNGNFGVVKDIDDGFITIDFVGIGEVIFDAKDSKSLWLGYACTISKSQGSGFAYTIVTIDSSAYIMLNAELLYTGITRAKKRCALVGENKAIRQAIKKRETKTKQTYLGYLLMEN